MIIPALGSPYQSCQPHDAGWSSRAGKKVTIFWRISTKIQAEANDNVTLLCPLLQAIQHERNERYKYTHHNCSFEKSDLNLSLPLPFRIYFHTFFCLRRWPSSLRDRCNLCLCRLWGRTQSRPYQPSPSCLWNGYVDVTTHWKRLRKRFLILTKICVTYLLPTANQRHEKIPTGQLYIQLRESTLLWQMHYVKADTVTCISL